MATDRNASSFEDEESDGFFGSLIAEEEPFDRSMLLALGAWGLTAIGALVAAILLNQSPGVGRGSAAVSAADLAQQTQRIQRVSDNAQAEARRLSAAAEILQSDRDRLFTRVTAVEQALTAIQIAALEQKSTPVAATITDSTEKPAAKAPDQIAEAKPETAAKPAAPSSPSDPVVTGSIQKNAEKPATPGNPEKTAPPAVAAETIVERTNFGIDLGAASSLPALRVLWGTMRKSNEAALGSLRPIVVMKERSNGLGLQLRLVAGPLDDAATAARLCAALTARNQSCETAIFDGQRLSMDGERAEDARPAVPPPAKASARRRTMAVRQSAPVSFGAPSRR